MKTNEAQEIVVEAEDTEFGAAFDDEPVKGGKDEKHGKEADDAGNADEAERRKEKDAGSGDEEGAAKQKGQLPDEVKKPEETVDWKAKAEEAERRAEEAEKRAKDHQAAFTRGQQELAELKKKSEEKPVITPPATEVPVIEEFPAEVKTFLDDFPEAQAAINHLANSLAEKKLKEFRETLGDLEPLKKFQEIQQAAELDRWERAVVNGFIDKDGNYIEGVPDYYRIAAPSNKEFWTWHDTKGYGPTDPATAISRLMEWKTLKEEQRLVAETAEQDRLAREKAAKTQEVLKAGLPASQRRPATPGKPDENDFEGGFNDD